VALLDLCHFGVGIDLYLFWCYVEVVLVCCRGLVYGYFVFMFVRSWCWRFVVGFRGCVMGICELLSIWCGVGSLLPVICFCEEVVVGVVL